MSAFVPINIEYESASEEEFDDSKEIQIEEALKLYQTALKLHSEGPSSYEAAKRAYEELLGSEVFLYPESLTQAEFLALDENEEYEIDDEDEQEIEPDLEILEGRPSNTLTQLLFLTYRNYAQLLLDNVSREDPSENAAILATSLRNLCNALDKDDSDTATWQTVAEISKALGLKSVARLSYETVVQNETSIALQDIDDALFGIQDDLGIADNTTIDYNIALGELNRLTADIELESESPASLPSWQRSLMPVIETANLSQSTTKPAKPQDDVLELVPKETTWEALAQSLFEAKTAVNDAQSTLSAARRCVIRLSTLQSPNLEDRPDSQMSQDQNSPAQSVYQDALDELKQNGSHDNDSRRDLMSPPLEKMQNGSMHPSRRNSNEAAQESPRDVVENEQASRREKSPHKRSAGQAELPDQGESRVRSKRLKAKADNYDGVMEVDSKVSAQDQLAALTAKDDELRFRLNSLLSPMQIQYDLHSLDAPMEQHRELLKQCLANWDPSLTARLQMSKSKGSQIDAEKILALSQDTRTKSHADSPSLHDEGLVDFVSSVNGSEIILDETIVLFVLRLFQGSSVETSSRSLYESRLWSETMLDLVKDLLTMCEAEVLHSIIDQAKSVDDQAAFSSMRAALSLGSFWLSADPETDPKEKVQEILRERALRWLVVALNLIQSVGHPELVNKGPDLYLRYVWTMILVSRSIEELPKSAVVASYLDMIEQFKTLKQDTILLPNSSATPEISLELALSEINQLETLDFFNAVLKDDGNDTVEMIEQLEPILEACFQLLSSDIFSDGQIGTISPALEEAISAASIQWNVDKNVIRSCLASTPFFTLGLWKRLAELYRKAALPEMELVSRLRSIQYIDWVFKHSSVFAIEDSEQAGSFIELLRDFFTSVGAVSTLFETLDSEADYDITQIHDILNAVVRLLQLLQVFVESEDEVRCGLHPGHAPAKGAAGHRNSMQILREGVVSLWSLLYILVTIHIKQTTPDQSRAEIVDFLTALHEYMGTRGWCTLAQKKLLGATREELLAENSLLGREYAVAQLLYDLYGIKIFPHIELEEHGCSPESLARPVALQIMDLVMNMTSSMSTKDLLKADLKMTLEKMQDIIEFPKRDKYGRQTFNRRILTNYLKSYIKPLDQFQALRGIGTLSTTNIESDFTIVAAKGWFFLNGFVDLARFKSQKRTAQGTTEDLDNAVFFFKLDLEFDISKWETWFRLGQAFDLQIEDETTWTAEKLSGNIDDVIVLERSAIHCYTQAIAHAVKTNDNSPEFFAKMNELYTDFATRIYASSRAPFSMQAFKIEEDSGCFTEPSTNDIHRRAPHQEVQKVQAWSFAVELFRRALEIDGSSWTNWYLLGKCLWKIYQRPDAQPSLKSHPSMETLLKVLFKAITTIPEKKDNRHTDKDPILEPTYKLVSVVNKLVERGDMTKEEGAETILKPPLLTKLKDADRSDWDAFMLSALDILKTADRSNWHHRIVFRAAKIWRERTIPHTEENLRQAISQMHPQIFTKTMTIQVWKPEHERAGRHFVFTFRYVKFFVNLLAAVNDRANVELIGKRVRKRQQDYIEHLQLWEHVSATQLSLIRTAGDAPASLEDVAFKGMQLDSFAMQANLLEEKWADLRPHPTHTALVPLGEALELKKLNAAYAKTAPFDDLIGDLYARIFSDIVPGLILQVENAEMRAKMRLDRLLVSTEPEVEENEQAAPEATGQPARPKVVSRAEIRRRAEALFQKATPPVVTVKSRQSQRMSSILTPIVEDHDAAMNGQGRNEDENHNEEENHDDESGSLAPEDQVELVAFDQELPSNTGEVINGDEAGPSEETPMMIDQE